MRGATNWATAGTIYLLTSKNKKIGPDDGHRSAAETLIIFVLVRLKQLFTFYTSLMKVVTEMPLLFNVIVSATVQAVPWKCYIKHHIGAAQVNNRPDTVSTTRTVHERQMQLWTNIYSQTNHWASYIIHLTTMDEFYRFKPTKCLTLNTRSWNWKYILVCYGISANNQ